jgi:hypothetical protein
MDESACLNVYRNGGRSALRLRLRDSIPVDGLSARGDDEHEFTLHQFTILPAGAAQKFKITEFDKIKIA